MAFLNLFLSAMICIRKNFVFKQAVAKGLASRVFHSLSLVVIDFCRTFRVKEIEMWLLRWFVWRLSSVRHMIKKRLPETLAKRPWIIHRFNVNGLNTFPTFFRVANNRFSLKIYCASSFPPKFFRKLILIVCDFQQNRIFISPRSSSLSRFDDDFFSFRLRK